MSNTPNCPLCGQSNGCQRPTPNPCATTCWCMAMDVPEELLARVPNELKGQACICSACITAFHKQRRRNTALETGPGDFYFDSSGLMVFTESYHRRRGYCCGSGCRHCPYR